MPNTGQSNGRRGDHKRNTKTNVNMERAPWSRRALQRAIPGLRTPIILTGAMTPLGFEGSDGLQNLTESLMAVQLLRPGIYVVMHNRAIPIHRTRKEPTLNRFVWKDDTHAATRLLHRPVISRLGYNYDATKPL